MTAEEHVNNCMVKGFSDAEVATDRALKHVADLIGETLTMQRNMERENNMHGNAFSIMKSQLADAAARLAEARASIDIAHKQGQAICDDGGIIVTGGGGGGK